MLSYCCALEWATMQGVVNIQWQFYNTTGFYPPGARVMGSCYHMPWSHFSSPQNVWQAIWKREIMLKETSLIVHSPLVVEYCYLGLGQDRELGHLRIKSGQRCDGNRTRSRHGSTAILLLILCLFYGCHSIVRQRLNHLELVKLPYSWGEPEWAPPSVAAGRKMCRLPVTYVVGARYAYVQTRMHTSSKGQAV